MKVCWSSLEIENINLHIFPCSDVDLIQWLHLNNLCHQSTNYNLTSTLFYYNFTLRFYDFKKYNKLSVKAPHDDRVTRDIWWVT